MRAVYWNRAIRPARRAGHDRRAVPLGGARLLGRRNGSSHRGQASVERLETAWPNLRLIHLPVHASWLNQIEIYFSVIQRKVLSPNDAASLEELAARILAFQVRYEALAAPFEWRFTRAALTKFLERLAVRGCGPLPKAA